mmetsp:Transcript_18497/g.43542  ORF Transcript_18497/g.43542 Transcript_18497/m.43542 type:complete len:142 (+) Transcript_18497:70-495(+)
MGPAPLLSLLALALGGGMGRAAGAEVSATAGRLAALAAFVHRGAAEEDEEDGSEEAGAEEEEEGEFETPEQILAELDENEDGFLTFEEFMKPDMDASDEDKEELTKMIKKADLDGDGKISKEEIPGLMKAFEAGDMEEEEL